MTSWVEGNRSFFIGAPATLIGGEDRETASWASPHIQHNPAYKWVLGRFVEADRANNNRQLFSLEGLQMARPTIAHAPMNMSHDTRRVVGAYVAAELLYPTGSATAAAEGENGPMGTGGCPNCGLLLDFDDDSCPACGEEFPERNLPGVDRSVSPGYIARSFSLAQRKADAASGAALPDGSFPIHNADDLSNAVHLAGRAKDPSAAKAHIISRAKTLGLTAKLPKDWMGESAALGDAGLNPYIEALGVFWRHYFPEEYHLVQAAHAQGRLYFSMECVPSQIQCTGDGGCGSQFEYAGRQSPTYCDHLNKNTSDKYLIGPHFTAGAMLVPPVKPGWSHADVHSLVAEHSEFAERLYESIAVDQAHLEKSAWESTMAELLVLANR